MQGKFIVFEGIDGSGKSSQIKETKNWLSSKYPQDDQTPVILTREPGALPEVRTILKTRAKPLKPESELLLLLADRVQHVNELVVPLLGMGHWVLCDRYVSSTLAYQGYARGLGVERVKNILSLFSLPVPDLEIFIDIPVDESILRSRKRSLTFDRFESEGKAFLERVKDGYEKTAESNRVVIDGCQSFEKVQREIQMSIVRAFQGG